MEFGEDWLKLCGFDVYFMVIVRDDCFCRRYFGSVV